MPAAAPDATRPPPSIRHRNLNQYLFHSIFLVIIACDRKPDLGCLLEGQDAAIGFNTTPALTLAADGITLMADPDIFAAGDMHTGRATVIGAVAGGRMAARSIHYLITTGKIPIPENLHRRVNPRSILKGITTAPAPCRVTLKQMPVAIRTRSFTEEMVATLTDRQAHREAQRCLQCGTCCYAHPNALFPAASPGAGCIIGLHVVKGTDRRPGTEVTG